MEPADVGERVLNPSAAEGRGLNPRAVEVEGRGLNPRAAEGRGLNPRAVEVEGRGLNPKAASWKPTNLRDRSSTDPIQCSTGFTYCQSSSDRTCRQPDIVTQLRGWSFESRDEAPVSPNTEGPSSGKVCQSSELRGEGFKFRALRTRFNSLEPIGLSWELGRDLQLRDKCPVVQTFSELSPVVQTSPGPNSSEKIDHVVQTSPNSSDSSQSWRGDQSCSSDGTNPPSSSYGSYGANPPSYDSDGANQNFEENWSDDVLARTLRHLDNVYGDDGVNPHNNVFRDSGGVNPQDSVYGEIRDGEVNPHDNVYEYGGVNTHKVYGVNPHDGMDSESTSSWMELNESIWSYSPDPITSPFKGFNFDSLEIPPAPTKLKSDAQGNMNSWVKGSMSSMPNFDHETSQTTRANYDQMLIEMEDKYNETEKRLHVTNIPFSYKDIDLHRLFSLHGRVTDKEVIYNDKGSKGFGFVTMSTVEEAHKARKYLNGARVHGRMLEVNPATKRVVTKPKIKLSPIPRYSSAVITWHRRETRRIEAENRFSQDVPVRLDNPHLRKAKYLRRFTTDDGSDGDTRFSSGDGLENARRLTSVDGRLDGENVCRFTSVDGRSDRENVRFTSVDGGSNVENFHRFTSVDGRSDGGNVRRFTSDDGLKGMNLSRFNSDDRGSDGENLTDETKRNTPRVPKETKEFTYNNLSDNEMKEHLSGLYRSHKLSIDQVHRIYEEFLKDSGTGGANRESTQEGQHIQTTVEEEDSLARLKFTEDGPPRGTYQRATDAVLQRGYYNQRAMYTAQKGIRPRATDTVLQRDVTNRGTMEGPRREDQLRRATEEGRLKAYHQRAINAEHRSTAAGRRATHADPQKSNNLRPGFTITGEGPKRRFHHSQKDHEGPTRGYHPRQKDHEGPTRGYHPRQKDHEGPTRGRHVLIEDDPFWAQNGPRPRESAEWCRDKRSPRY